LLAIIMIIFIISAQKYSNILIYNKIGGLSLSELQPKITCLVIETFLLTMYNTHLDLLFHAKH